MDIASDELARANRKLDRALDHRDELIRCATALLEVKEVRVAAANWASDELIALRTAMARD
jgi:hypothetical protein